MADLRYVLVLTGPAGRRFGLRRDPTRGFVVDDVDAGAEVGEAGPTCQPIMVDVAGEQHLLLAGTADSPQQKFTTVNGHRYPIREGAWMSFPEPFAAGMVVTIAGLDGDGRELFRLPPTSLDPGRLEPVFGPGWTGYAPG